MRIRLLRNEFGYTQEELGKKVGQTKSNISKYETGSLEPGIDTLRELSKVFDVSLDYLMGASNIRNPYKEESNIPENPTLKQIECLSEESLKELEKYIQLLKIKDEMDKTKDEQSSTLERNA